MDRLLALSMEERQQWLYDEKGHPAFNDLHVDACVLCSSVLYDDAPTTAPPNKPPNATFRLESYDEDTSKVFAVVGPASYHIADLFFNGAEWLFLKYDADGEIVNDSGNMWIDADPEEWARLRDIANENAKDREQRNQTVNDTLDAALALRRRQFRDDTRELAELGAKGKARAWWSMYRLWLQGCTGFYAEGGWRHDGDTCPVHEL